MMMVIIRKSTSDSFEISSFPSIYLLLLSASYPNDDGLSCSGENFSHYLVVVTLENKMNTVGNKQVVTLKAHLRDVFFTTRRICTIYQRPQAMRRREINEKTTEILSFHPDVVVATTVVVVRYSSSKRYVRFGNTATREKDKNKIPN